MLGMPGMRYIPLDSHTALTQWQFSPFPLLVLATVVITAAWYLRARSNLAARGRHWSWKRTTSFLSGLVLLDLALQSPVATFTMEFFEAHVIQHLLLMVVAPPLLAMGAPMTLALQTSNRETKVRLLGILNSRPFRLMTHPVPVAFLYYFSMFAFFLTFALGFAMRHMWLMDGVNLVFLFASTLFWWPIVGLDPIPHWRMGHGAKMTSLLLGVPIESFLALAQLSTTRPVASI
jgi:putative membrane protein